MKKLIMSFLAVLASVYGMLFSPLSYADESTTGAPISDTSGTVPGMGSSGNSSADPVTMLESSKEASVGNQEDQDDEGDGDDDDDEKDNK